MTTIAAIAPLKIIVATTTPPIIAITRITKTTITTTTLTTTAAITTTAITIKTTRTIITVTI